MTNTEAAVSNAAWIDGLVDAAGGPGSVPVEARAWLEVLFADQRVAALGEIGQIGLAVEVQHALAVASDVAASSRGDVRVADAVVIGGLPRTGTTLLQDLLTRATGRRTLRSWEALRPGSGRRPADRAAVIQEAAERFQVASELAPRLQGMHPLTAEGIEECTPLLQHSLACLQWAFMLDCPSYVDVLLEADLDSTYALWAKQLQLIDPTGPRWLLKSPMHLNDYGALLRWAPGARLVHVRRGAAETVCSFLNLCLEGRRIFDPATDPSTLGPFWLPRLARLLDRAGADIVASGVDVVHIDHLDLVMDPSRTVRALLEVLDLELLHEPTVVTRPSSVELLPLEAFGTTAAAVRAALGDQLDGPFLLG